MAVLIWRRINIIRTAFHSGRLFRLRTKTGPPFITVPIEADDEADTNVDRPRLRVADSI